MKFSRRGFFGIGLTLFGGSFFLNAIGRFRGSPKLGYDCAWMALRLSGDVNGGWIVNPLDYLSVLFSGWINPIFVVAAVFVFLRPSARTTRVLAIAVLAMIPFCWIVFHYHGMYPREGHVVWIAGMLLVLREALRPQIRPALRRMTVAV